MLPTEGDVDAAEIMGNSRIAVLDKVMA